MRYHLLSFLAVAAPVVPFVRAIDDPTHDAAALSLAVKQLSNGVVQIYNSSQGNGQPVGTFPQPYYWWESGVAWDSLVNYWFLTGDASHNELVRTALLAQVGPDDNFMPPNQTKTLGNDDQAAWALTAMSAAERNFPSANGSPAWLDLAKAVFDNEAARWDTSSCGGGLRWQIFTFNAGYDYKNSASNSFFFQLAARLAHFTGNKTYSDWASKTYEWSQSAGLIDGDTFAVYDGTDTNNNCSQVNKLQWSYLSASYAYGSALLYNMSSDTTWRNRTDGHLSHIGTTFFPNSSDILVETACEPNGKCNTDQLAYKALAARWLALTPLAAPWTRDTIAPKLNASAKAAAERCTTADGRGANARLNCRDDWAGSASSSSGSGYNSSSTGMDDDTWGLGQQLAALEVMQAAYVNASVRLATGSEGTAGTNASGTSGGGSGSSGNGTSTGSGGGASSTTGASAASGLEVRSFGALVVAAVVAGAYAL